MVAAKKTTKVSGKEPDKDPKVLRIAGASEKSEQAMLAQVAYDPAARSLPGAHGFIKGLLGEPALTESLDALATQIKDIQGGNLAGAERTLVAQANTLDAIFNELARRAALNMGEYLAATETYLRLALKAQSQCRTTLETLAAIKNPPMVFARQANISAGHQQINNGVPAPPRAREIESEQTKLSGGGNELLPNTSASGLACGADPALATLGTFDGAKVARG